MRYRLPTFIRSHLKATSFWQDNYLLLREFKYFPWIAVLALVFALGAAAFEGLGLGFLLAFLQSLVNPNAEPIQTGVDWFDIWILGVNKSAISRLYRVSALILLVTWIRAGFNYLTHIYTELTQLNLVDRLRKRILNSFSH